ncbi:MAG TPA: heme exporter protein CcmB, partial [Thermoanaerobaculia bacterium]|nr:heme exporter protein CcmB [Thermoanaerobaculia bacterium]
MLTATIRKEAVILWRSRSHVLAVFVFGAAALLLFSFAVGPVASLLRSLAGGFLWLALLLSSTLTLA